MTPQEQNIPYGLCNCGCGRTTTIIKGSDATRGLVRGQPRLFISGHPVLILTHDNLALTQRAVESVRNQDIETRVYIIDNGSKDETVAWAEEHSFLLDASPLNVGVSAGWNHGLKILLATNEFCTVIGSDTVLPPWFCRTLLACDVPFITGVAVDNMQQAMEHPVPGVFTFNPDFSGFCIRRDCWERVGPFDERMRLYASDCDFHVRAHRMGVPLYKMSCAFYHERSSTLRLAPEAERQEINEQANKDRAVFQSIYGCLPGSEAYEALFR